MELQESYISSRMGEVHTYFEGCGLSGNVAEFGDRNAIGVVLEGEDEVKLHYPTSFMTV